MLSSYGHRLETSQAERQLKVEVLLYGGISRPDIGLRFVVRHRIFAERPEYHGECWILCTVTSVAVTVRLEVDFMPFA